MTLSRSVTGVRGRAVWHALQSFVTAAVLLVAVGCTATPPAPPESAAALGTALATTPATTPATALATTPATAPATALATALATTLAPLRVFSSNGVRPAIEATQSRIEQAISRAISTEFSTAVALKRAIDAGEPFDVAILTPALIDDLVMRGKAVVGSRVDVARVGVGVGAREGAPKSDVSTPEALKRTLLAAKVVAYTAEGQSRATVDKALATLGLTAVVAAKSMLTGPGEGPSAVAAGKADLVMTLISEILIPGVQLLGPFPPEMQNYITFTAVRSPNSANPEAADALLRYLAGPEVAAAMKAHALEPIAK